jgi:hypothetical protein
MCDAKQKLKDRHHADMQPAQFRIGGGSSDAAFDKLHWTAFWTVFPLISSIYCVAHDY